MISARLDQVLAEQSAARREQPKAASELEAEIAKSDREQVIEKVPTPGSIASPRCGLWMPTAIRGAGTNVIDAGSDPSVAYFMDEVYLAGTAGLQFDLLDVERVEVLKGPQGTLFGRNAAGGAISIISKRPSRTFDAWAAIEGGDYGQMAARAGITGPIGDSWSYRLSTGHRQRDAFTVNPAGRDPGSVDTYSGRGQLMYEKGNLTALLSGDYFTSDNGMTNQFPTTALTSSLIATAAAAQPRPILGRSHRCRDGQSRYA